MTRHSRKFFCLLSYRDDRPVRIVIKSENNKNNNKAESFIFRNLIINNKNKKLRLAVVENVSELRRAWSPTAVGVGGARAQG